MTDLISRQAAQAIPPLPKCYREYATSNLNDAYDKGWEDALFSLNALPTVEEMIQELPTIDAVSVVRCKDCKYYKESVVLSPNKFCFRMKDRYGEAAIGYNFADDDFCSYGERSEE